MIHKQTRDFTWNQLYFYRLIVLNYQHQSQVWIAFIHGKVTAQNRHFCILIIKCPATNSIFHICFLDKASVWNRSRFFFCTILLFIINYTFSSLKYLCPFDTYLGKKSSVNCFIQHRCKLCWIFFDSIYNMS